MKTKGKIAVIDYGVGNLYSLTKAVHLFTDDVFITDDSTDLKTAQAIILPGVGAFAAGMEGLEIRKLVEPIKQFALSGKPMLGICLGAQLMLSKGFEFGEYEGLGLIPGNVKLFPPLVIKERIPHIGWNEIYSDKPGCWKGTILDKVADKSDVYFVHSYILIPDKKEDIFAYARYGGHEFCAAIKKGNIYGTQFHPEKSGKVGLTIIKNFVNLA